MLLAATSRFLRQNPNLIEDVTGIPYQIPGFSEGGEAARRRKRYTDFGSGWQGGLKGKVPHWIGVADSKVDFRGLGPLESPDFPEYINRAIRFVQNENPGLLRNLEVKLPARGATVFMRENTGASAVHFGGSKNIYLNPEVLNNTRETVDAIAHEATHAKDFNRRYLKWSEWHRNNPYTKKPWFRWPWDKPLAKQYEEKISTEALRSTKVEWASEIANEIPYRQKPAELLAWGVGRQTAKRYTKWLRTNPTEMPTIGAISNIPSEVMRLGEGTASVGSLARRIVTSGARIMSKAL